jgi:hypothetical protein
VKAGGNPTQPTEKVTIESVDIIGWAIQPADSFVNPLAIFADEGLAAAVLAWLQSDAAGDEQRGCDYCILPVYAQGVLVPDFHGDQGTAALAHHTGIPVERWRS